jgi:hypothetical protein
MERSECCRIAKKDKSDNQTVGLKCNGPGHTAQQAGQRKRPKPCGSLMILLIAGAPATLQAHEQTDGQRNSEAAKNLALIHNRVHLFVPGFDESDLANLAQALSVKWSIAAQIIPLRKVLRACIGNLRTSSMMAKLFEKQWPLFDVNQGISSGDKYS